ncbi:MAG: TRAP transporter large permease subunit, partial [Rhodospirillales bacterium]|nr:TRAP transporter large permease subunit [Rhodospirillales bacterium]
MADSRDTSPGQIPIISWATTVSSIVLCLTAVTFSAELHLKLGLTFFTEQGLAVILAFSLAIIYLNIPLTEDAAKSSPPWYDVLFAALGFGAGIYLAVRFDLLTDEFFYRQKEAFVIGIILVPLTIEGLRRTAGWSLTSIVLFFFIYAFWGNFIPGKLQGRAQSLESLVPYVAVDNVALFGLPMTIVCTIVVMFIFMGQMLLKSGGSEWFTDIATALMGRTRGGSAKIAVVASGLFGSISGSAVSNVASTGVITIPLMRQAGYERKVAGAFEAVASTGGQIMPPIMGAAAFLMAE